MTLKQQACIMLFTSFMFFCWNEEVLLSFVSERIKLFYRINLLGTAFKQKNKLPFKLLKPQFVGRTHVLPNLSPYLNISYCFIKRTLKKDIIFYTLILTQVKQNS